ncbi:MAG: CIA30 family protein [Pseudomonadota bacterium]
MVIDDGVEVRGAARRGRSWQLVTDQVMGGVSRGTLERGSVAGRPALRMRGPVMLENNGGFIQMALDLAPDGGDFDARDFTGIALDVLGNGETYNIHLRTHDLTRPWQSYRQTFVAPAAWTTHELAFDDFTPHRTVAPLNLARLRRIGLVAIGRAFEADLAIGGVRFYSKPRDM